LEYYTFTAADLGHPTERSGPACEVAQARTGGARCQIWCARDDPWAGSWSENSCSRHSPVARAFQPPQHQPGQRIGIAAEKSIWPIGGSHPMCCIMSPPRPFSTDPWRGDL